MGARGEAVAATTERIIDAAIVEFATRSYDDVTLAEIAARAGCNLHSVLRRFGSKEGVFRAGREREEARVFRQRGAASPDDVPGVIRVLMDHYEEMGPLMVHFLGQEARVAAIAELAEAGRAYHRRWVAEMLVPALRPRARSPRDPRIAELLLVTDLLSWKVLRREQQLDRAATEAIVLDLVERILDRRRA